MLDTDQLRSFLAIVDSGSFTKAAERVHKTQSAVSMHIRRLEEQLGCALFVKQGRGAKLTAEGESLIDYARRIIQVEAGAVAALSRRGLRGSVRLGIPDDYAESFLAEVLARFNRRHPLVEVSATCEASQELAAQISGGALELALVTDYPGLHGFELLREEPLVWVAAVRFRIEAGQPVPLALGSGSCVWRRAADEALAAAPRATRGLFFSKNFSAIGSVVRAGLAVTPLPASMVGDGLRVIGPDVGLPKLPLTRMGLIHAPGRQTEETKAFADAIRVTVGAPARQAA
ncbi:MAG: LysR family transcriptional regulator [Hyphomicrobiales bacterium]|nr:LysR family transcriptional regulator [Hyphomicrobiales bacterium]